MRLLKTISLLVLANCALAQSGLLIPPGMNTMSIGSDVSIAIGGDAVLSSVSNLEFQDNGTLEVGGNATIAAGSGLVYGADGGLLVGGNLIIENSSTVEFADGTQTDEERMKGLMVAGNLQSFGDLTLGANSRSWILGNVTFSPASRTLSQGILEAAGNWQSLGDFTKGENSEFIAAGSDDQIIEFSSITFPKLTMAGSGRTTIRAEEILIPEGGEIDFQNGILRVEPGTNLLVENGAEVLGGNDGSFVDGIMSRAATGGGDPLYYPVGDGDQFNPITLQDIQAGTGRYVISAQLASPNSIDPLPAEDVVGVSSSNMWTLQLQEGEIDSAAIFIDFANEDLSEEAFVNYNPVNAEFIIPVVVAADSLPGEFVSLGTGSLEASDSLTFGLITSDDKISFSGNTKYIALGRAPIISPNLRYYIPDVFSPSDFRQENRAMRVFGEFIDETADFEFTIYNEFNRQMYTTDSFQEANEVGWDGTFNGIDQPSGTYMWIFRATIDEVRYEDRGLFYLVR
jgi:hypothetical protein